MHGHRENAKMICNKRESCMRACMHAIACMEYRRSGDDTSVQECTKVCRGICRNKQYTKQVEWRSHMIMCHAATLVETMDLIWWH